MSKSDVGNLHSKQCVQVIVEDNKDNDEVIVPDILAVKEQKPVSGDKEVDFYENEVDPDKKEVDPPDKKDVQSNEKDVQSNEKEIDHEEKEIDHNKKDIDQSDKENDPEDTEMNKQCDLHDANSKFSSAYLDDISLTQELCEDSNTESSVSSESNYSTTNQSHEEENVKSPKQTVSRIEIPSTKVTAEHVRKLFPSNRNKLTEDMIQQKIKEISERKSDALAYFRNFLRKKMLQEAKKLHIRKHEKVQKYVQNFKDISKAIKNNHSIKFYRKLWEVTTGQFDRSRYWAEEIAAKYMMQECLTYNKAEDLPGIRTNCFEHLAKWARADLVRRFQILGKKHHGTYLSVSINKGTKKRRRLGVFQKEFIINKPNKIIPKVSLFITNYYLFQKSI